MTVNTQHKDRFNELNACVLIPTYNNGKTLNQVIDSVFSYTDNVIVVNDGSTDNTHKILEGYGDILHVISYQKNKGKGFALKTGFKIARNLGFNYVISIDSDGQHYASDLPVFIETVEKHPNSLVIGSRVLKHDNMSKGSTFANRFSNFWFTVQTSMKLPDTQSGYRAYPLNKMGNMPIWSNRYEAELEILVFSAWRRIKIVPVSISVYYAPPSEKISHFNPIKDFTRISILNTLLVFTSILYGYPAMAIRYIVSLFVDEKK